MVIWGICLALSQGGQFARRVIRNHCKGFSSPAGIRIGPTAARSEATSARDFLCVPKGWLKSIAPPNGFRERSVMPASTLARGPMCCNILCREFWMSANQTVGVEYHA
jgi:hypothetical protein